MGGFFAAPIEQIVGRDVYPRLLENPSIVISVLVGGLTTVIAAAYLLLLLVVHIPRPETTSERTYKTISSTNTVISDLPLPLTQSYLDTLCNTDSHRAHTSDPPIELSVVVPAYNESLRLPGMLAEAVSFLSQTYSPGAWEIVIVDDGSTDGTSKSALDWVQSHNTTTVSPKIPEGAVRVVTLTSNRGKGGAVTHGMRHVRGAHAIFADADGATRFSDIVALFKELGRRSQDSSKPPAALGSQSLEIAVGSRAHMVTSAAVVQRSLLRNLLMYGFHTYLRLMGIRHVEDTQCGFKLFSRRAVCELFPYLHNEGWVFDVELLLLAQRKGLRVVEVPVTWHEVEGTKVNLARDSLRMAWDLLVLRAAYAVGVYSVQGPLS